MRNAPTVHRPSFLPRVTPRANPSLPITSPPIQDQASKGQIRSVPYGIKRALDYVGAGTGLLALSPLLLLIALLIRLESNGPIFFRQKRMGKDGQFFWIWKFRTMVPDAEQRLKELEH